MNEKVVLQPLDVWQVECLGVLQDHRGVGRNQLGFDFDMPSCRFGRFWQRDLQDAVLVLGVDLVVLNIAG